MYILTINKINKINKKERKKRSCGLCVGVLVCWCVVWSWPFLFNLSFINWWQIVQLASWLKFFVFFFLLFPLEPPVACSLDTTLLVSGTSIVPGPLQDFRVASTGCIGTCPPVPGTALASQPLQHPQMASTGCLGTCPYIPGTALASQPL